MVTICDYDDIHQWGQPGTKANRCNNAHTGYINNWNSHTLSQHVLQIKSSIFISSSHRGFPRWRPLRLTDPLVGDITWKQRGKSCKLFTVCLTNCSCENVLYLICLSHPCTVSGWKESGISEMELIAYTWEYKRTNLMRLKTNADAFIQGSKVSENGLMNMKIMWIILWISQPSFFSSIAMDFEATC